FSSKFARGFDRRKRDELIGQGAVGGNRDDGCASRAGADDAGAGIGSEVDIASEEGRERNASRGDVYELYVETIFFIEPDFLGDPKRGPIPGKRAVRAGQRLELVCTRTG